MPRSRIEALRKGWARAVDRAKSWAEHDTA
jgi:hypothetical protein